MVLRMSHLTPYNWSISTRLALWYGLTLFFLLSLFALFCYTNFHNSLHRDFDRHLTHEQHELMSFLQTEGPEPLLTLDAAVQPIAYQTEGIYATYIRLLSPEGEVRYASPNFKDHEPLPVALERQDDMFSVSRTWEGDPARTRYTPLRNASEDVIGWVEITGFEWSLHEELYRLRRALIAGIAISVLLAIGGGYLLAQQALQPVVEITEAANNISAHALHQRLPVAFKVQDELTHLAQTINDLLERLERSFLRERRFTTNAAHELVTPLATLRGEIDLALRTSPSPQKIQETLYTALNDIDRMNTIIRSMLQLSRADKLREAPAEAVDLSALCLDHLDRFRDRAEAQDVTLAFTAPQQPLPSATGHRDTLGKVIDNLLDNALKYTPPGGRVGCRLDMREGRLLLTVEDTGIGFTPDDAAHLFDRFYRADNPDVQAQPGSGLGLAIAQATVQAYDGTLTATSPGLGQGSRFVVSLPRYA